MLKHGISCLYIVSVVYEGIEIIEKLHSIVTSREFIIMVHAIFILIDAMHNIFIKGGLFKKTHYKRFCSGYL